MKRIKMACVLLLVVFCFCGCGKKLEDRVTLLEQKIAVGTNKNLPDLFQCEEGISIGFKNSDSFDYNKVGSYSIEATITDGKDTAEKTFIVEVYDDEKPVIKLKKKSVTIYEGDKFEAKGYASVTDNSKEKIDIEIENGVDTSKVGEYTVTYKATDSSGNSNEKQMPVIVKKTYKYSELKGIVKKILKKKKYNKLKLNSNSDKKRIWVNVKDDIEDSNKKDHIFYYEPYWTVGIKHKKIDVMLFVYACEINFDDYLTPSLFNLKSSKGSKKTYDHSRDIDYDYDWFVTTYYNFITYHYKPKDCDKLANILSGNKIELNGYTEEKNMKKVCSRKEIIMLHQLSDFYNELSQYM